MEKIKKYVERFFKTTQRNMNIRYSISVEECEVIARFIGGKDEFDRIFVVSDIFDFGYAKGYRAAMAEMKKSGVV